MTKYLIFLIADISEIKTLTQSLPHIRICALNNELNLQNISLEHYFFPDQNAIVIHSGIGKVNAAVTLTYLLNLLSNPNTKSNNFLQFINNWKIMAIINIGFAAGLNKDMQIGDVFQIDKAVYHDFDLTEFGHPYGHLPVLGGEWNSTTLNTQHSLATCWTADTFCNQNTELKFKFQENLNYLFDMEAAGYFQTWQRLSHPEISFYTFKIVSDLLNQSTPMSQQYQNENPKKSNAFVETFKKLSQSITQ